VDFRSAHDAKLEGVAAPEVLLRCAEHGCILVSHDDNSMLGHSHDLLVAGHVSPGVLMVHRAARSIRETCEMGK
jgi:metallophosphoesterase superfamily enzyme